MTHLENENIQEEEILENQAELNSVIDNEKVIKTFEPDSMDATVNVLKGYADRNILSSSHAILELIKNSYDADAKEVQIKIKEKDHKIEQIEISDDGDGFTQEGYTAFKLVGTSNKKQNQKTALGRTTTGMNGSGAYSTIKLGKELRINSFNLNWNFALNKKVSWEVAFKNPNEKLRKLLFLEIPDKRNKVKGTTFKIENIIANVDFNKIENNLRYLSLNKDLKVQVLLNNIKKFENFNLLNQIDEMEKHNFTNGFISFYYENGKIFVHLKLEGKINSFEKKSTIHNFAGVIQGKYLSVDRNKLKKEKDTFSEEFIFNEKDFPWNLFYNNEMLILTAQNLGMDFSRLSIKEKGTYGFRNSFGYTSIKDTKLVFDESRTNLTDDEYGEHQKYETILKEIYDFTLEKIKLIIKPSTKKTKGNEGLPSSKDIPLLRMNVTSREQEILDLLATTLKKIDATNPFFPQMCYCIGELQRLIRIKKYEVNYNISYHSIIRVYCEILFIYKVYDFFRNKKDFNKVKPIITRNKTDFLSIGQLMKILDEDETDEIKNLKEDFRNKTNQNELNIVRDLIKKLNNHMHYPQTKIKISISQELINIFSSWI